MRRRLIYIATEKKKTDKKDLPGGQIQLFQRTMRAAAYF